MVSKREVSKHFNIVIVILMVVACIVNGLPHGPLPPDGETGFSFRSFKDFILAGFPSDTHTHDPSEKYKMPHEGQPPSVAEVAIADESHDQKLVVEDADDETRDHGSQTVAGHPIEEARIIDNGGMADEPDVPNENNPMQEEPMEELDVPHEHPEAEYKGVMEQAAAQVKDVTFKEEI